MALSSILSPQLLCFLSGTATAVIGFLGMFNITEVISEPFSYMLNIYLMAFGVTAILLEADSDRMGEGENIIECLNAILLEADSDRMGERGDTLLVLSLMVLRVLLI
jgi:hypothetical protein